MARISGNYQLAMELYDQAIESAKANNFIQNEAIANELAAKYYLSRGRTKIARTHLVDACLAYSQWGAVAKVKWLEEKYAQLLAVYQLNISDITQFTDGSINQTSISNSGNTNTLDWITVIKASQALSSEIVLASLMEKLMKILIENAGTQRGVLLAKKDDKLIVEAEGKIGGETLDTLKYIPYEICSRHNELGTTISAAVSTYSGNSS